MTLEKIFTEYWSQVTLLLVAISYFVKRVFDRRSKKIEVNHSLFQENRMTAVNDFFQAYAYVEFTFQNLSIWHILQRKVDVVEIDKLIWPPINDLKRTILTLKIFFNAEEHILFEETLKNVHILNRTLSALYFDETPEMKISHKVNDYNIAVNTMVIENGKNLNRIGDLVKSTFFH